MGDGWEATKRAARAMGLGLTGQAEDPAIRPKRSREDAQRGTPVRPVNVATMIGQDEARTEIVMAVKGARMREELPPHVLLSGPAGLGKTSLAMIIAGMTGGEMIETTGQTLNTTDARVQLFEKLRWRGPGGRGVIDVMFIDEVHELNARAQAWLLKVLEDRVMHAKVGTGKHARVIEKKLPPFVIVGATTDPGNLSKPFLARFGVKTTVGYYNQDQLVTIIERNMEGREYKIDSDAARLLARRSRGTPREALHLLTAAHDWACVMTEDRHAPITTESVEEALKIKKIDVIGLTADDIALLKGLCTKGKGGPLGLDKLTMVAMTLDLKTIKASITPYLMRIGFLRNMGSQGWQATEAAYEHLNEHHALGVECPAHCQED